MTPRCVACPQRSPFPDGNGDFCRINDAATEAVAAACTARHPYVPSARHYPSLMIIRSIRLAQPCVDPDIQRRYGDDDYEEETDYRIPPIRQYRGRIHIRDRYRAMPKYYPDELCDD